MIELLLVWKKEGRPTVFTIPNVGGMRTPSVTFKRSTDPRRMTSHTIGL